MEIPLRIACAAINVNTRLVYIFNVGDAIWIAMLNIYRERESSCAASVVVVVVVYNKGAGS